MMRHLPVGSAGVVVDGSVPEYLVGPDTIVGPGENSGGMVVQIAGVVSCSEND